MSRLLGDDHDLAVLRQMLTNDPGRFDGKGDAEVLLALIDHRRDDLEQKVLLLGERFFQEKAGDFSRRLKSYWKEWRAQAEQEPSDNSRLAPL